MEAVSWLRRREIGICRYAVVAVFRDGVLRLRWSHEDVALLISLHISGSLQWCFLC